MPTLAVPGLNVHIAAGKRKSRSQICDVHTIDRRIEEVELDVVRSCADNPDKNMAFLLDGGNQYYDNKAGEWLQILDEQSLYPMCSVIKRDESNSKKLLLQIYREAKSQAKAEQYKKIDDNKMTSFMWIVSIFCATIIVVSAMAWLRGG